MPSSQQQDEGLAAAVTKQVSALLDANSCSICHDLLCAPVSLPCSHVFCSECVRRHLSTKSLCPHPACRKPTTYMQLTPLRGYDVALESLRRTGQKVDPAKLSGQERLVFLSRKACSRARLMERLRAHDIPTHGATDAIANRYNEFVLRWNANLDAGVPKSKKSIVAAVMAAERGTGKDSRRLRCASSFFVTASSAKGEDDIEVPTEGDDFATLVKKTKARMERKRKLTLVSQGNEKRICLKKKGHDLKAGNGLQGNLADNGVIGDGFVPQSPNSGALSQPGRGQQKLADVSKEGTTPLAPDASHSPDSAHVSPHGLSIYHSVCSLNIATDEFKCSTGGRLPGPSVEFQPTGLSTAGIPPRRLMLISQTTPEKETAPVAEEGEVVNTDGQNRTPNGRKLNMHKVLSGSPQFQGRSDNQEESRYASPQNPYMSRNLRDLPPTVITPTEAQLERAERNRLAAIERRKRFYARQMRQPEL